MVQNYPFIDLSSLLDTALHKKESYILFVPTEKKYYIDKKLNEINNLLLKHDKIFVLSATLENIDEPISEIISIKLLLDHH